MNRRKVLITGGSRGIGLALAKKFAEDEYQPILIATQESSFDKIKEAYPDWLYYACDLSKEDSAQKIITKFPEIDILVNNAGIQFIEKFGYGKDSWTNVILEINVNLIASLHLIEKYLPILKNKNNSAIINVTSGLALIPKESGAIYCATKSALRSISISLRWQLEGYFPRIIEILPPLVDTKMTQGRGKGKISPEDLAKEFWRSYKNGQEEIYIGKSKILYYLSRASPNLARKIMRGDRAT